MPSGRLGSKRARDPERDKKHEARENRNEQDQGRAVFNLVHMVFRFRQQVGKNEINCLPYSPTEIGTTDEAVKIAHRVGYARTNS
jgi:hypothetical protein